MAFTVSLLCGVTVMLLGARHLTQTPDGAALARDVWTTLGLIVVCANAGTLAVIISATRRHDRSVALSCAALHSLPHASHAQAALPPTPDDDPAFNTLHAAIADARERIVQALNQTRMDADRNRAIVETVFASVFAVDGGGRIISANPAAVRMFALPVNTLEGVVLSDLIATDSLRMSVDECGSVTFDGAESERRFATRIRLFGRRSFPAEVAVTPLALDGQRAWAVFVHDLTESHATLTALHDARIAAAASNRARTAFLARMSHELRTPLSSMIGFTKIVRRSRSSQLSERDRHYLDRVQAGSEHLLALVSDVLDLSRIESGTIDLKLEAIDIAPIVREIVSHYETRVVDRPVVLEAAVPDDPAIATVDAARLRQVLTNLVGNAVKFTARGSVHVSVTLDPDTGRADAIIVRDTGIGIPLERQSRIFESFEQGDDETSHRYGGSGLGLALSHRIAQQMGCMLSVESMPGTGSTFTLAFAHTNAVPVSTSRLFQIDAA